VNPGTKVRIRGAAAFLGTIATEEETPSDLKPLRNGEVAVRLATHDHKVIVAREQSLQEVK
jgi:hypothetical protein